MNTEMKKTVVYSTGDKILNIMKEQDMDIPELSLRCGVREDVLMDILAGIREADISTLCKIADGLEICVRELCPDEESYVVPVEKDILAKLIVISELKEISETLRLSSKNFTQESAVYVNQTLKSFDQGLAEVVERLIFTASAIRDAVDALPVALRPGKKE